MTQPGAYAGLLRLLAPKRCVFASYHHGVDRPYYEGFAKAFAEEFDVCEDRSVFSAIESDDADYVIRTIREKYITGSSCTLVFCGAETHQRKFVDWEIKATLDACHGLIGVLLPSAPANAGGRFLVPERLLDNIDSGYAVWMSWSALFQDRLALKLAIERAKGRSSSLIRNARALRRRNG